MVIVKRTNLSELTAVPNAVIFDRRMSIKAKGMYCTLLALENTDVSERTLSDYLGCSRTSVRTSLKELESLGYLTRKQERSKNNNEFGPSTYILNEIPVIK